MKSIFTILTFILLLASLVSCNMSNVEPEKVIKSAINIADTIKNTDMQDYDTSEISISPPAENKTIIANIPKQKKDTLNNQIQIDTVGNQIPQEYYIGTKIDDLNNLLNSYVLYKFTDCSAFEITIKGFTVKFFSVIEQVDLNDTVSIYKLQKLENFFEIFEPEFVHAEDECPDLYNDYMEFLDEYTETYHDKLELLFGERPLE